MPPRKPGLRPWPVSRVAKLQRALMAREVELGVARSALARAETQVRQLGERLMEASTAQAYWEKRARDGEVVVQRAQAWRREVTRLRAVKARGSTA